jgi:hypothetical protein
MVAQQAVDDGMIAEQVLLVRLHMKAGSIRGAIVQ